MNRFELSGAQAPEQLLLQGEDLQGVSVEQNWSISKTTYRSGLSTGVEVIAVDNGACTVFILPTRGMGLWKIQAGEVRVGWDAPAELPVHPMFVNLKSRNGLGWLDGFNELLCRCGLSHNGPPGLDEEAASPIESEITLHGPISNKPAETVTALIDEQGILIQGITREVTLFGPNLVLQTDYFLPWGESRIILRDAITNKASRPAEMQLLYHINVGSPLLEAGSHWAAPVKAVYPRDEQATVGMEERHHYSGPVSGFAEQVYLCQLQGDQNNRSNAMLVNSRGDQGFALEFDLTTLPCFSVWKNTQALEDGYCTGLEPATNFPNFKTVERKNGRVVSIAAGETWATEMTLSVLTNSAQVEAEQQKIASLQQGIQPKVYPSQAGLTVF